MLIKSSDGGELIGERDNVRSLSSPIIRPVTDPSAARLISTTLMKLAKQLLLRQLSALRHHGRKRVCVCRAVKGRRNRSDVQKSSAETQKCKRQENGEVRLQRENVSESRSIRFTSSL